MKDISLDEKNECGQRRWVWGDLYRRWENKIVSRKIFHL